jgi:pantoate--beta-alanine ligase
MMARDAIVCGETSPAAIKRQAEMVLLDVPEIRLEYFDLVDPETRTPVDVIDRPVRAAAAMWVGATRLIDNIACVPPP